MKILVAFTGGTISCSDSKGVLGTDERNSYLLLNMYNKIDGSVRFDMIKPYTILSENLCGDNLMELYNALKSCDLSKYDGVIVTHGTDTLQYTSAFLGYAFSEINLPMAVVSANYPLSDSRSNGFSNFCAAVDFIKSGQGRGVFVAYKNDEEIVQIHRATRLLAHNAYSDSLYSIFNTPFGYIKNGGFIKNSEYSECENGFAFDKINISSQNDVLIVKCDIDINYPIPTEKTKAILIEGFHSGTLATTSNALKSFCNQAKEKRIPIFLTGICSGFEYESKLLFDKLSIQPLPAASPVSMEIKLRLLDRQSLNNVFLPCGGDFIK